MQSVSPAKIGPFSPRRRLRRLDGRTKAARFLRETEARLIAHCGGPERATAPQRFLVERLAADLLRLEMLDQRLIDGKATDTDAKIAHALRNSVRLALRDLGLQAVEPKPPSLDEIAADIVAKRRGAA